MNQLKYPLSNPCPHNSVNHPRKVIAGACLVISLTFHLAAIVSVLLITAQQKHRPTVTYIDLDSIAESTPPATPVIHSPAPKPALVKTEQQMPVPETHPDQPKTESPAAPEKSPVPEVLATPLGRGMTSGYFSSLGEGKNLRDDIREYYFAVLEKVNNRWWQRAETLKEAASNDGIAEIIVGRDGSLQDLRLARSTGSREVDRAIIEVLKDTAPFPPLPASYALDMFRAPLKIAAPLRLFSIRSIR